MSDPSIENGTPYALPKALRNPQPRSVELLLESRLPARMAWVDEDGHAQVAPMWFEWVDTELLISTFTGAQKLSTLVDGAHIAVTIDTAEFPYRSVKMSGPITVEPSGGLTDSYQRRLVDISAMPLVGRGAKRLAQGSDTDSDEPYPGKQLRNVFDAVYDNMIKPRPSLRKD